MDLIRCGHGRRLRELISRPAVAAILDRPAGSAFDPPLRDGVRIGGRTPLVAACMLRSKFDLATVRLLLDAKAGIDVRAADQGESFPLMAGLYNQPCVELLLERRADTSQRDGEGYSPLLAACEWGLDKATASLLAAGADTALEGHDEGYTPVRTQRALITPD